MKLACGLWPRRWRKPSVLLKLFQLAYFENSFSIAMAGYALVMVSACAAAQASMPARASMRAAHTVQQAHAAARARAVRTPSVHS